MKICIGLALISLISLSACGQEQKPLANQIGDKAPANRKVLIKDNLKLPTSIKTGAEQTEKYLPLLKGKRVGMVVNNTSIIGKQTSVDSLVKRGVKIERIFGPEHGFRGAASAGISVSDEIDQKTGIKVISLYGKHSTPTAEDLSGIDVMIFDIQDVGVRFYTYINTLQHVMEACAANNKELIIFDRPNPNGYLIDGPILDPKFKSGIGIQPIPIAHGLTVGEYAQMLNGEGWLKDKVKCKITVIKNENYNHDMEYTLPVKPSPNLNTQQAILLYPSTCLFEGIYLNHGRGTQFPFTVIGAPYLKGIYDFSYTPTGIKGMAETPIFKDQVCYGIDLRNYDTNILRKNKRINLSWVIDLYKASPKKEDFFNSTLSNQTMPVERLIGVADFRKQVIAGKTEDEIRASWEPGLSAYKTMRKKYLLYK
ncbi:exo-beta-N-acetylmuramidase NamZ domain-containing protein [Pedobacter lithocola]|uniref:Exo-beta-N-acetylmuramidase NamZ domain-containing protein n=1 Tax=Pedobacter lithocola TaxID=1908239 RepID=A0ABV8P488_9SPHI